MPNTSLVDTTLHPGCTPQSECFGCTPMARLGATTRCATLLGPTKAMPVNSQWDLLALALEVSHKMVHEIVSHQSLVTFTLFSYKTTCGSHSSTLTPVLLPLPSSPPLPRALHECTHRPDQVCTGKITAIWCLENAEGELQGIAYLNSITGLQLQDSQTGGCLPGDWTGNFTSALFLATGESIIAARTCTNSRCVDLWPQCLQAFMACGLWLPSCCNCKNAK